MVRQSQLRSPGFSLSPAAPLELVRKGMKTVEADLTGRSNRQPNKDAKSAGLRKKLAQAQLEVMKKSGVDVEALARDIRELRQQRPKRPSPAAPGLHPEVPGGMAPPPGHFLVAPPYSYDWSETQQIDIAPDTLSAYANPETGALGFQDDSSGSDQVDISNAAAAVGIYFKPEVPGTLSVQSTVGISELWAYDSFYWAGAHTRGWAGFLVQAYDATNSLVQTPIYQQIILFDKGTNGDFAGEEDFYTPSPVPVYFSTQFLFVSPNSWYAIWFWCGGNIHAEGWNYWGYGSDAFSQIDASVPYFMLNFEPERKK